jgi:hypothetical protein
LALRRIPKLRHGSTHRNAHQPFGDPVAFGDSQGLGLLVLAAAGLVHEWPTRLAGDLLAVVGQGLGQTQHVLLEVLVAHARPSEESVYTLGITDRTQGSAKPHPVKSAQHSDDILLVSLYKGIHGVAPSERSVFGKTIPYTKERRLSSILVAAEGRAGISVSLW